MKKRLQLGLIVAAALITACATSPTGRRQFIVVSDSQMSQLGAQTFSQLKAEGKVSQDGTMNRYVQCVSGAVTRVVGGSWEVVVFDDKSPNAFALPGGKIGVHSGLLKVAENQHQLAAVLGHEVAHVLANHGAARVSSQLGAQAVLGILSGTVGKNQDKLMNALGVGTQVGMLGFGRKDESEADELGLEYMAKAGFDPAQSISLWENMAKAGGSRAPEFLSTHPSPSTRMKALRDLQPKAREWQASARAAGRQPSC